MNRLGSNQKKSGARIVVKRKPQAPLAAQSAETKPVEPSEPADEAVAQNLQSIPLFQELPANSLSRFEAACRWQRFSANQKIVEKGDRGSDVFFIAAGRARVLDFATSGRVVAFSVLGPGDFFGELAAIDGLPRSATVVTETPCQMAVMSAKTFLELVTDDPNVTVTILKRLAFVIRSADARIIDFSVLDAEQRLCLELLRVAIPDPAYQGSHENLVVYPVPTQQLIASNIGVTRETVARIFGRLSHDGIIERKGKTLYIREKSTLEALTLPYES